MLADYLVPLGSDVPDLALQVSKILEPFRRPISLRTEHGLVFY